MCSILVLISFSCLVFNLVLVVSILVTISFSTFAIYDILNNIYIYIYIYIGRFPTLTTTWTTWTAHTLPHPRPYFFMSQLQPFPVCLPKNHSTENALLLALDNIYSSIDQDYPHSLIPCTSVQLSILSTITF